MARRSGDADLERIAERLCERQEDILAAWRHHAEKDPHLAVTVSSLAQTQFDDHIPAILDAFADDLRRPVENVFSGASEGDQRKLELHGLHRWQQGYQLHQLTREWGLLQLVLLDELDRLEGELPDVDRRTFATARKRLARLSSDGLSESAGEYWRLHQVEAAGHARDLAQALKDLRELEAARSRTWHEAAHDLRGSVHNVESATRLLERDGGEDARERFFALLRRSVRSLRELLEDLLDLARLDAGHEALRVERFDAAELLRDLATSAEGVAEARGLALIGEGPETLPVEGDRGKVQRIVQNLLLNALKYTDEGEVRLTWSAAGDDGARWLFCVMDTGPGFDQGSAAPLAEPLVAAGRDAREVVREADDADEGDADGGDADDATDEGRLPTLPAESAEHHETSTGEGIGLSIVKRLCELLHAALELEVRPGSGTTFRVTLPRHYDDE